MAKLNKVFLMGNLTRDPELRSLSGEGSVVTFCIAVNRSWLAQDGTKKEETTYVDVAMFGNRSEVISKYFSKGHSIFIEGRLQFREWNSKSGEKRNALSVVAEDFQFIGGKPGSSGQQKKPPF